MIGRSGSPRILDGKRRSVMTLFAAIVLAGCSSAPSRQFQADMRFAEGADPLPVVLTDETGLVTGIEGGPFDLHVDDGAPAIQADPGDPNAFFVTWGSGPIRDAALSFKPFQDGYLVRLELHTNGGIFGGGSTMEMRLGAVRIVTSRPIPLGTIQVGGSANT